VSNAAAAVCNARSVKNKRRKSVLTLFGTRPEIIKLAPVIRRLERRSDLFRTVNVASGQHGELMSPFLETFKVRVDFDLRLMIPNQDPDTLQGRIVRGVSEILDRARPDVMLVQGDTTTALAGAIAGHQRGVAVGHVEAGLRSGNVLSPYPEEVNRIAISGLATIHFAATENNRVSLLREGIRDSSICVVGNPIVDALEMILQAGGPFGSSDLFAAIANRKCVVLTAHRRESFGRILKENLRVIRDFVQEHDDVVVVFPVHPNPNVSVAAHEILSGCPRSILIPPLPYLDFIGLVRRAWLVVSDSGGIQEEVPTLGKPLLILRDTTERPECIEAGMARLVGGRPETLKAMLDEAYQPESWVNSVQGASNPFGERGSAKRIVDRLAWMLAEKRIGHSIAQELSLC